ncbi:MAG: glycosyltransferase family 2 protein [Chloroflexota bacterium]|nr:glycosyltransferase family 2 protein [Chloroflexota bacterium]
MSIPRVGVAIPNWNGEKVLPLCLNSVLEAFRASEVPDPWEIVVVDDCSTDGSAQIVRTDFPMVKWIPLEGRGGFIVAANEAVSHCTNDYVLMLNNDAILERDFFDHWHQHFQDEDVFAVTSWMVRWDHMTFDSGRRVAVWDRGLIRHWVVGDRGQSAPTLFGCGGATIYDRHKFEALGGFDPLYRPMYIEDLDISYRAWKRGWKVIYEPACVVYHHHAYSSQKAFPGRRKAIMVNKNHFLFVWKNITDPRLIRRHLLWLPVWLIEAPFQRRRLWLAGFFGALARIGETLRQRRIEKQDAKVSDSEIFELFKPTEYDLAHSPRTGMAGTA